jgi:hypothetical protein
MNLKRIHLRKRIMNELLRVQKDFNLRLPIKLFIVDRTSVAQLISKYKLCIAPEDTDISAICYMRHLTTYFLFYNFDFWKDASTTAIAGNIAHELAHRELLELRASDAPDYFYGELCPKTFIAAEWFADILAVAKGYGNQMVENKKYLFRKFGYDEHPGINLPSLETLNSQISRVNWSRAEAIFEKRKN